MSLRDNIERAYARYGIEYTAAERGHVAQYWRLIRPSATQGTKEMEIVAWAEGRAETLALLKKANRNAAPVNGKTRTAGESLAGAITDLRPGAEVTT